MKKPWEKMLCKIEVADDEDEIETDDECEECDEGYDEECND